MKHSRDLNPITGQQTAVIICISGIMKETK
jgi:hypothetical protein